MALSNYNQWAERVLAADLSSGGFRLAVALQRLLLGFNVTEDGLGVRQLRDTSRLHGWNFGRARAELVAAGLIEVTPGSSGRGHATRYRLLLDSETSAQERRFSEEENVRSGAEVSPAETSAETSAISRRNVRRNVRSTADTQGVKVYTEDQGLTALDFQQVKNEAQRIGLLSSTNGAGENASLLDDGADDTREAGTREAA